MVFPRILRDVYAYFHIRHEDTEENLKELRDSVPPWLAKILVQKASI